LVLRDGPAGSLSPGICKPVMTSASSLCLSWLRVPEVAHPVAQAQSSLPRLGGLARARCVHQLPAETRAGSPPPSTPRMPRGRWRGYPRAVPRARIRRSRRAAPSARYRAPHRRRRCKFRTSSSCSCCGKPGRCTQIRARRRPPSQWGPLDRLWSEPAERSTCDGKVVPGVEVHHCIRFSGNESGRQEGQP
jgi:hypothetical protein